MCSVGRVLCGFGGVGGAVLFAYLATLLTTYSKGSTMATPRRAAIRPIGLVLSASLKPSCSSINTVTLVRTLTSDKRIGVLTTISSGGSRRIMPYVRILGACFGQPSVPINTPGDRNNISLAA